MFSIKYVVVFRIALTEEPKLLTKQKHSKDSQLSILLSSSDIVNLFILRLRKFADEGLKSHYRNSNKTSIIMAKTRIKGMTATSRKSVGYKVTT